MRDSMVVYKGWWEAIKRFSPETQIQILNTILNYGFYSEIPNTTDPILLSFFDIAKPQIDKNNHRYENAKKGGAPKGNQNARKQPKNNQNQPNVNGNVNDTVNANANTNVSFPLEGNKIYQN